MRQKCAFALLLVSLSLILFPGCPAKGESGYKIDSFAISSQKHVFSREYTLFVKLSEGAFNSTHTLAILQDGERIMEVPLNGAEAPPNNELSLPFPAEDVGEHELEAVLEDEEGNALPGSKTLSIEIMPLGFYDFADSGNSYQVEPNVWCAQEFVLENNATPSKISLQLRSLVQARAGKNLILEIRTPSGTLPGTTGGNLVFNSTLDSGELESSAEWHDFALNGEEFPAGTYWILLKREDTVGNVGWVYSADSPGRRAFCRDLSAEKDWEQVGGEFAFRIQ
jgi:hypothetical protein